MGLQCEQGITFGISLTCVASRNGSSACELQTLICREAFLVVVYRLRFGAWNFVESGVFQTHQLPPVASLLLLLLLLFFSFFCKSGKKFLFELQGELSSLGIWNHEHQICKQVSFLQGCCCLCRPVWIFSGKLLLLCFLSFDAAAICRAFTPVSTSLISLPTLLPPPPQFFLIRNPSATFADS